MTKVSVQLGCIDRMLSSSGGHKDRRVGRSQAIGTLGLYRAKDTE